MVTDTQKQNVIRYLNQYCFDNVWSAMAEQYRTNILLNPVSDRLSSAAFMYDNAVVGLPTTGVYRVFACSRTLLRGAWAPDDSLWYTSDTIAQNHGVKFTVYDIAGRTLPMSAIWVLFPRGSDSFFVAVHKPPLTAIIPNGISTDLYLTQFRNTRADSQTWSIYSAKLTKTTDADTAIGLAQHATAGTAVVTINGVVYTDLTTVPARNVGDYVDVMIDPTIMTSYVVEVDDTDNGYASDLYAGDREILHCPKANNPNQYILTHDGATLFIRDTTTKQGVYFHRADANSVKQITHNDISASRTTIDAFKAAMGSAQVEIVVQVRALQSPRTLMSDSGWIADLYLSSDDDIVSHLRGVLDDTLTFWKASELEKSGYIALMFSDPDDTDVSRLDDYVTSLGYYATGAILSTNVYTGTYDGSDMIIMKSFSQRNKSVTPLVYVGGSKIAQSFVNVTDYGELRCGVSLSNASQLTSGSPLLIRTMDAGAAEPLRFTPTADSPSVVVSDDYMISVFTETLGASVTGYKRSTDLSYVFTPQGLKTYQMSTNADGSYTITFMEDMFGTAVVFPKKRFMWSYTESLDAKLSAVEPLIFPVTIEATDGTVMPLLSYGNIEVYINGNYLVKDVDFTVSPLKGTTGGTALLDVIVNCGSYFDTTKSGNQIEIFISSDQPTSQDAGYVVDNVLPRKNLISFWYPLISSAFVEGVPTTSLLDYAVYMVSENQLNNGSIFELKPLIPEFVAEVLADYTPIADEITIEAINTYYGRNVPSYDPIVTLAEEHRLYSTFITAIIRDVLNGSLVIVDDANDATFLAQFSAYDYLKERDPTLYNDDARVDRRFLSVGAVYAQPGTSSVINTRLVQRLITLTLITQPVVLKETLV